MKKRKSWLNKDPQDLQFYLETFFFENGSEEIHIENYANKETESDTSE